jgi:hypothetical protein
MYIMSSDISRHRRTSLVVSTDSSDQSDMGSHDDDSEHSPHQSGRPSPLMLSDPLDSPSSDARSFDEDDMYGSDSDVETISLRPFRAQPAINAGDSLVCLKNI